MRSKTVKRILKETPENTRELVRQRANEMVKEKALTPESEDQEKLLDYLKREAKGHTEFRMVVHEDGTSYIHVLGRDSETFDFKLCQK